MCRTDAKDSNERVSQRLNSAPPLTVVHCGDHSKLRLSHGYAKKKWLCFMMRAQKQKLYLWTQVSEWKDYLLSLMEGVLALILWEPVSDDPELSEISAAVGKSTHAKQISNKTTEEAISTLPVFRIR